VKGRRVKNGREIKAALSRAEGCGWDQNGTSHCKGYLPDGTTFTFYDHGEFPKGIACKFTKILAAAGLLSVIAGLYLLLAHPELFGMT
jgi:hypothetical protein